MDFEKYRNLIPYPTKAYFTEVVEATSSKGTRKSVSFFDEEGYRDAVKNYHAEDRRIHNEFVKDLLEELNLTGHPKAAVLIEKAWEHGHSGGYKEVVDWAHDLAELMT